MAKFPAIRAHLGFGGSRYSPFFSSSFFFFFFLLTLQDTKAFLTPSHGGCGSGQSSFSSGEPPFSFFFRAAALPDWFSHHHGAFAVAVPSLPYCLRRCTTSLSVILTVGESARPAQPAWLLRSIGDIFGGNSRSLFSVVFRLWSCCGVLTP
jgi:hypothetical protein